MSNTALLAFALVSLWPFHAPSQTANQHFEIPAWKITVSRDKFTGGRTCRLYQGDRHNPSVSYARSTLSFQFARKLDTTQASFRLDDGPVRDWTDIYPELVRAGATLEGHSLDNPTSGRVLLPAAELRGAHAVTIRPTPSRPPRRFTLDGLGDALASARGLGCDAETGFDR